MPFWNKELADFRSGHNDKKYGYNEQGPLRNFDPFVEPCFHQCAEKNKGNSGSQVSVGIDPFSEPAGKKGEPADIGFGKPAEIKYNGGTDD